MENGTGDIEETIRGVLDSYNLKPEVREKAFQKASNWARKSAVSSFKELYSIVGEVIYDLVDSSYKEQFLNISLDATSNLCDTKAPPYDRFDAEKRSRVLAERLAEQREQEEESQTLAQVMPILVAELGESYQEILTALFRDQARENLLFKLSPDEIHERASEIKARLDELVANYSLDGRLVMPQRKIRSICFNPLTIQFESMQWKGIDPLEYFRQHPELHGLTRTHLNQKNRRLYNALVKQGKMDQAIPVCLTRQPKCDYLRYYQEHPELHGLGRTQLKYRDRNLYRGLLRHGEMDQAIPLVTSKRDWKSFDPLRYYQEHPELHGLGRSELRVIDTGLHSALSRQGKLEQAIPWIGSRVPEGCRDWSKQDPLEYFRQHPELHGLSREQLKQKDRGSYCALLKQGKLEQAIPEVQRRDWSKQDPLEYFRQHPELHGLTRKQLRQKDSGLWRALIRSRELGNIIPVYRRNWQMHDPLEYYQQHTELHGLSRRQLKIRDCGLYFALLGQNKLDLAIPRREVHAVKSTFLREGNVQDSLSYYQ